MKKNLRFVSNEILTFMCQKINVLMSWDPIWDRRVLDMRLR